MLQQLAFERLWTPKNNNRTAIDETYTNYFTHATVVSLSIICLQGEQALAGAER